jgi:hypothetical protein
VYCANCADLLVPASIFCGHCGTRVKSPDASDDDVQYIGVAPSVSVSTRTTAPSIPSARVSESRTGISSTSSPTNEVRAQKAATTKQDHANSKDILPTSSFGLDPRGKAQQQRTAEIFTIQRGMSPIRVPGALKRLKLSPHQTIDDWSEWVRNQAHGFKMWDSREDPENFVEDEDTLPYVGVVYSPDECPLELEYGPGTLLGNLLADIPDDGKTNIALIVPVRNISKEAETLALPPAKKRAKSPTGVAIPKRGGRGGKASRGGRKANAKSETTKEEVNEDIQEDSNDFPEAYNVLRRKRKNHPNSGHPSD